MELTPGTRLGPFEITAPLGAGGMGEVYRARDARLGRDVAIKALPTGFAQDPERLARFEREAKLLASLSHPNVAGIHGLEEVAGARYLVLEFVEGETLAARLARGPLPVREALEIALKIAAGVEAAHESSVVHRDLKPGNVMITPRGGVKVLDFGLAKSGTDAAGSDPGLSASPTMTHAATSAGVILGTAAYMSPEQARGRVVDKRSDIWSFGCVLYECLAGRQAYQGETASDVIARILEREPDWSALPAATPARVRTLLSRCLRKDPHERLRDIGDARLELSEVLSAPADGRSVPRAAPSRATMAAAAGILAVLLVVAWVWGRRTATPSGHREAPLVLTAVSPDEQQVEPIAVALSKDGTRLAFVGLDSLGRRLVLVRDLSSTATSSIRGSEGAVAPFFSPDGRWLAFAARGALWKARLPEGQAERIRGTDDGSMDPGGLISGGAWGDDGFIYYSVNFRFPGILRVNAEGGAPTRVAAPVEKEGQRSLVSAEPPRTAGDWLRSPRRQNVARASSSRLISPAARFTRSANGRRWCVTSRGSCCSVARTAHCSACRSIPGAPGCAARPNVSRRWAPARPPSRSRVADSSPASRPRPRPGSGGCTTSIVPAVRCRSTSSPGRFGSPPFRRRGRGSR